MADPAHEELGMHTAAGNCPATLVSRTESQPATLVSVSYRRAVLLVATPLVKGMQATLKADLLPGLTCALMGVVNEVEEVDPDHHLAHGVELVFTRIYPKSLAILQTYLDIQVERVLKDTQPIELKVFLPRLDSLSEPILKDRLFVAMETPVPVGAAVRLHMQLDQDQEEITVDGEVREAVPLTKAIYAHRNPGISIAFRRFWGDGEKRFDRFLDGLPVNADTLLEEIDTVDTLDSADDLETQDTPALDGGNHDNEAGE